MNLKSISPRLKLFIISCACGFVLALAFPPFNCAFLAWFVFIPFFIFLEKVSSKRAFIAAYIFGITFFLTSIFWLINITLIGWILLCLYLGAYFAIFGLISNSLIRKIKKQGYLLLALPAVLVSLEYIRSYLLSGFGWNGLGFSQYKNLVLIQIADFSGSYGVTFLIIFVNCSLWLVFKAWQNKRFKDCLRLSMFLALLILGVFYYGAFRLSQKFSDSDKSLRLSLIQPNIAQELKWNPSARGYILSTLSDLSAQAAMGKPDIIIWPESAVPDYLFPDLDLGDFQIVSRLAKELNAYILTGVIKNTQGKFYNSALLVCPEAKIITQYDKLHLVPFGEFIPFRKTLPFLATVVGIGDFTPGQDYTLFRLSISPGDSRDINFGVLICFEDAFPDLAREFRKRGASILVNITNDAWFGKGGQPEQHLSQSVFRAIENRVSVVRCANTGISGLIDARGRLLEVVKDNSGKQIFVSGLLTFNAEPGLAAKSFYCLYGDWFAYICIGLTILYILNLSLNFKSKV